MAQTLVYADVVVELNSLDVSGYGVWLRGLHTEVSSVKPGEVAVAFDGVSIHRNRVTTSGERANSVRIDDTNDVVLTDVEVHGNPAQVTK